MLLERFINGCDLFVSIQHQVLIEAWFGTCQSLLHQDALRRVIRLVQFLKGILHELFVIDSIVELAIVVKLVLSVDFATPS